jgi:hypothetical protein
MIHKNSLHHEGHEDHEDFCELCELPPVGDIPAKPDSSTDDIPEGESNFLNNPSFFFVRFVLCVAVGALAPYRNGLPLAGASWCNRGI